MEVSISLRDRKDWITSLPPLNLRGAYSIYTLFDCTPLVPPLKIRGGEEGL